MGQPYPWPLAVSYGLTDSVRNSGGFLTNLFAEKAPADAIDAVALVGTPGLKVFSALGVNPLVDMIDINGACYAVTTNGFYRLFPGGGSFKLGNVVLRSSGMMVDNGLAILIVDQLSTYSYTLRPDEQSRFDTSAPFVDFIVNKTGTAFVYPASTGCFLDGYQIFDRIGTQQFVNTGLYNQTFTGTAFSSAETNPDSVLAVAENQQQLWIYGKKTIEVWYDTGVGDSPFLRIPGAVIPHGIAGPYAQTKLNGNVAFLTNEGQVFMGNSYTPSPISTHAVEEELSSRDISQTKMWAYIDNGHGFIILTCIDITFGFDMSTGLWHRRKDRTYGRDRASCYVRSLGKHLVGDFQNGNVYEMSDLFFDNAGDPLVAEIVTRRFTIAASRSRRIHPINGLQVAFNMIEVQPDVGVGNQNERMPVMTMAFSNDDGETWSGERPKEIGRVGENKTRVRWWRLGSAIDRRFRFRLSDPVKRRIASTAFLDVE